MPGEPLQVSWLFDIVGAFRSFSPRAQVILLVILLGCVASIAAVGLVVYRKGGVRATTRAAVDTLLGKPERYSYTLFTTLIVLSILSIGVFGYAFSRFASETEWGSRGVAEVVIGLGTNFTVWAGLVVLSVVAVMWRLGPTLAEKTARKTRFTAKEIEQIAAEAKTTDGASRLIGSVQHSEDQLRAKFLRVFNGEDINEGPEDLDELAPESKLDDGTEHGGAIENDVAGAIPAPGDEGPPDFPEPYGERDHDAYLDVLEGALDGELLASQIDYDPRRRPRRPRRDATESKPDAEPEPAADESDSGRLDAVGLVQRKIQLAKMDAAAAASLDELFARFVVPAALTALGCFTILGTVWVHPLLYPVVASVSLFVGAAVYRGFKWKRRRNVEKARETRQYGGWNACDALAKRCETERGTEYYLVWMAGHRYFGFDKHRVARKAANRWHQRLNGDIVAPAIHEHFAKSARSMMPLTHHIEYRDERRSRAGIYDTIADVIRESDDEIVPKMHLAEMVVDRGPDFGYDPDLVAEVYEDMVGDAIAEFEVELRNTNGEPVPVTLVTLRNSGIPLDMETLRSEFSNQVNPEDEPLYELPEVEDAYDIEDALAVGVPPGVDPAEWDRSKESVDTAAPDADLDVQPAD